MSESQVKQHMGLDQWGNTFHDLGPHPRAELMRRLGCVHAEVIRVDPGARRVGWKVGPHWVEVFQVLPLDTQEENEHE